MNIWRIINNSNNIFKLFYIDYLNVIFPIIVIDIYKWVLYNYVIEKNIF